MPGTQIKGYPKYQDNLLPFAEQEKILYSIYGIFDQIFLQVIQSLN